MSDGKKYYCFCSSNCKYETMTKEQILAAIAQAVATGSVGDCDTGFVTTIKEKNSGRGVTFWVGTQEQYNAISSKEENCMYIITDDTSSADLLKTVQQMAQECKASAADAGAANHAAQEAAEASKKINPIDISETVSLSEKVSATPAGIILLQVQKPKYVYAQSVGAVFFEASIVFCGKINKGERLVFVQYGGYKASNIVGTPVLCRGNKFVAEYAGDMLYITATETIDTGTTDDSIAISGWYFCDGE